MLNEKEKQIQEGLIELGLLKITFNPCTEISQEEWEERVVPIRHTGEPVYLYYTFKESRKIPHKFDYWLLGDWQFKMLVLKTNLNVGFVKILKEYPELLEVWKNGEAKYSLNVMKTRLKKRILIKEGMNKWSELYGDKWQTEEVPDCTPFINNYVLDKLKIYSQ